MAFSFVFIFKLRDEFSANDRFYFDTFCEKNSSVKKRCKETRYKDYRYYGIMYETLR